MTNNEIKLFNKFLNERGLLLLFHNNYKKNRFLHNPEKCAEYLEKSQAERVIPLAFTFPKKTEFGREFWLNVHKEWTELLSTLKPKPKTAPTDTLSIKALGLQIVSLYNKGHQVLNSREISIGNGKRRSWVTINQVLSKKIFENHLNHLVMATSKDRSDVIMLFNRKEGIKIYIGNPQTNKSVSFTSKDCVTNLMKFLKIPRKIGTCVRKIEVVNDNSNYLMIKVV